MGSDYATLRVYRSLSVRRSQRWRWKLTHANGRKLATSGEGYANRSEARAVAERVISGEFWSEKNAGSASS